ncbi:MAG: glycosyltransferase [Pseudomonadota bacterium]
MLSFSPNERIAILLHAAQGGGAERAMITVANRLAAMGAPIDLLLTRRIGPLLDEISDSVNLIDLQAPQVRKALGALNRYVKETRPAVLMSALPATDALALIGKRLFRWPTRLVISVQNNPSATASGHSRFLEKHWPFLIRTLYPSADRTVAISRGVAEELRKIWGAPNADIPVINNPLDLDRIDRMRAEPADLPWFSDGGPPVALAVGRLTPQKDYPTMLRAFAEARAAGPMRLAIAGEGPDQADLEALARELGVADDVAFLGFLGNPFAAMSAADMFVLSSRWEGFANVVAEAVRCGARIVSTDCVSGPAEILQDGRWGQLTPVGDVSAFAQAMRRALTLEVDKAAMEARAQDFEADAIAARYLDYLAAPRAAA